MHYTVRLVQIAETRKVLSKHLPGQKSQTFVGQRKQFRARSAVAIAQALEQLLELPDSVVRHAGTFPPGFISHSRLYRVYRDELTPPSSRKNSCPNGRPRTLS